MSTPVGGTVQASVAGNLVTGIFVQEGDGGNSDAHRRPGRIVHPLEGDTSTTNATLVLPMARPYSLTSVFVGNVVINTNDAANALLGGACSANPCLSPTQLTYLDQTGNFDGLYNLGDFLAYADRSGLNNSPAVLRVLASPVDAAHPRAGGRRPSGALTMRLRTMLSLLAVTATATAAGACGGGGDGCGGTCPVRGSLDVTLASAPNNVGAMLLTVNGGQINGVTRRGLSYLHRVIERDLVARPGHG